MADFNNTSAKPTADLRAVACTLNCNASNLAGLAYLLRMLMEDYGHKGDLAAALTALAGIAERAGGDSLDAAATLEKIEAQMMDCFSVGDNVMSNQSIDEMRRAGAIAMRDAMNKLPAVVSGDSRQEAAEYFAKREAGIAALAEAIGPLPPHAAGAFAVIAEFVAGGEQDACTYDMEAWRPEAAMSKEERAKAREAVFALDCQSIN